MFESLVSKGSGSDTCQSGKGSRVVGDLLRLFFVSLSLLCSSMLLSTIPQAFTPRHTGPRRDASPEFPQVLRLGLVLYLVSTRKVHLPRRIGSWGPVFPPSPPHTSP